MRSLSIAFLAPLPEAPLDLREFPSGPGAVAVFAFAAPTLAHFAW